MAKSIMIVMSRPLSADDEAEFNRWYDEVHVPEVTALFSEMVSARRYKTSNSASIPGITGPSHPYLIIYELTATTEAELESLTARMSEAHSRFDMNAPIDVAGAALILALPIGKEYP